MKLLELKSVHSDLERPLLKGWGFTDMQVDTLVHHHNDSTYMLEQQRQATLKLKAYSCGYNDDELHDRYRNIRRTKMTDTTAGRILPLDESEVDLHVEDISKRKNK